MANTKSIISVSVSLFALIAANLYSLYGVFFLGWNSYQIIILYWFENISILIFSYLKIKKAEFSLKIAPEKQTAGKILFGFGAFTIGHGIFILYILGLKGQLAGVPGLVYANVFAIAGFFISHTISYWVNYIGQEEYKNADVFMIANNVGARILPMHLVAMFGVFASAPAVILVIAKMFLDISMHLAERVKYTKFVGNLRKEAFNLSEDIIAKNMDAFGDPRVKEAFAKKLEEIKELKENEEK